MKTKLNIDDRELKAALSRVGDKFEDLSPVLKKAGEILVTSIQENFQQEGRYSSAGSWKGGSKKWKPLSMRTLLSGRKAGTRKILTQRGILRRSITYKAKARSLKVGTNKVYAAIHQFGGKAGRGRKVNIPARPFLVFQRQDMAQMVTAINRFIKEAA